MPNLKDIKNQISSVGSTKKITSAMKMVAASKLRRSQEKAEAARPYSSRLEEMLSSLASSGTASGEGVIQFVSVFQHRHTFCEGCINNAKVPQHIRKQNGDSFIYLRRFHNILVNAAKVL